MLIKLNILKPLYVIIDFSYFRFLVYLRQVNASIVVDGSIQLFIKVASLIVIDQGMLLTENSFNSDKLRESEKFCGFAWKMKIGRGLHETLEGNVASLDKDLRLFALDLSHPHLFLCLWR